MPLSEFERIFAAMVAPAEEPVRPVQESVVPEADRQRALDLAGIIMQARWRVMLSSLSREECRRLEVLQVSFDELERDFATRFPEGALAETLTGFDLTKLRSFIPPAEPERKPDYNWGFQVVNNTAPAPKPIKERRPYGACSVPGQE